MITPIRRYDVDWVRVIAIGLLLIYHIAIAFQPWGVMIGFIANKKTWESLWIPMTMLNVWRIPLLFFVSGMGVYFAIQNRTWKQLVLERARRILLPLIFGIVAVVPAGILIWRYYYNMDLLYSLSMYNPGHLWFLGNIFAYVIMLSPLFFYLEGEKAGPIVTVMRKLLSHPLGLIPFIGLFLIEAILVKPNPYEMYAMTWHGFILGLLAFFSGYCFVRSGEVFWKMIVKWRWLFLLMAVSLYTYRMFQFQMRVPAYQISIESNLWILSVFSFAGKYLNRPSAMLKYMTAAAYPVYILHIIFMHIGSILIFPLDIVVQLQFVFVLIFTVTGCLVTYEVIRRVNFIRPLFGLKMK